MQRVHEDLTKERNLNHKNRTRIPEPKTNGGINSGSVETMVLHHDKEESTSEAVELWSLVDHSGDAENLHKIRQGGGKMTTKRCDG